MKEEDQADGAMLLKRIISSGAICNEDELLTAIRFCIWNTCVDVDAAGTLISLLKEEQYNMNNFRKEN